jgi:hypothetical protein
MISWLMIPQMLGGNIIDSCRKDDIALRIENS